MEFQKRIACCVSGSRPCFCAATASPALEFEAKLPGHDEPLHIVGLDVFRAARLQPALIAEGADLLEQGPADARDRDVAVTLPDVAIGRDVAVDECPLLGVRDAEDPVRQALRVGEAGEPRSAQPVHQRGRVDAELHAAACLGRDAFEDQLSEDDEAARVRLDEAFTRFEPALLSLTTAVPGDMGSFVQRLQEKLDEQMEVAPVNKTIERPF